jgi:hypothetical protein
MPSPIGYSPNALLNTPMNQISGVPSATYPTNLVATAPLATGLTNFTAQNLSASPGSTDYTQLSSSTLMAIGQNPYAGQGYPPQGSIFNNQVMPSGYPMQNTAGYPYSSPAYPTVDGGYPVPNTADYPYSSSAYPTVGGGYSMPNTAGSLTPQQQAILTQIQNDPTTSPEQKQAILQQLLGGGIGQQTTAMQTPIFNNQPAATQIINTGSQPTLQELQAQNISAQILQITADKNLSPELKAVRIKDLQLQFQNLQVVANTGTNIQDQINQIANNPNIPPEAKQQLIAQLTGQIQQTNVDALAPQQPDIFKILLGGVARQFIPSIVDPENPLVNTGLTVASLLLGTDLVTGLKRRKEDDSKTIEHPTATATYEDDGETKTVETTVEESSSSNSETITSDEYLVA